MDISSHSTLTSGLVSYWELNEPAGSTTWADSHGSNHLTNNSTDDGLGSVAGKNGNNAAVFTPADTEYLSIADASQTGLDLSGDWSYSTFISWSHLPVENEHIAILGKWTVTTGGRAWTANLYNPLGENVVKLQMSLSADGTANDNVQVPFTPTLDQVYHIVGTFDISAGEVTYYVDGVEQGSGTQSVTSSLHNNSEPFRLGSWHNNTETHDGTQQFVGIWNRLLTTSEITDLGNSGNGLHYTEPLALSGGTTLSGATTINF